MRLAACQLDVVFNDPQANLAVLCRELRDLAPLGVDLAVFPEAFLNGYVVSSAEEAREIALAHADEVLRRVAEVVDETKVSAIFGYLWRDGEILHNSAAMILPGGRIERYDKAHLPFLGYDRFAKPGHDLPVFETPWGRIGMLICYDLRIPEATRVLALRGADLLVLPTNWPEGAELSAKHYTVVRASENRIFVAAVNRVGTENGTRFFGHSTVSSPEGEVLGALGEDAGRLIVDLDLSLARQKNRIVIPGEYETHAFAVRQPEAYKPLNES
ncbi:MAG: carbon-nitrogen hydrolase family protein [Methanoregulaceae archaeon]|nr:carbon-nitrogen hydrolase family protein [Methanoregulaceae archaeon]